MNHIYRIVWNHATSCYQAVTESAKGQGKNKSQLKTSKVGNQLVTSSFGNFLRISTMSAVFGLSILGGVMSQAHAQNINTAPGFLINSLGACDDCFSGAVSLGFSANLYGTTQTQVFVNNNGNITFGVGSGQYSPQAFSNPASSLATGVTGLIAPFFSDVYTSYAGSSPVTYGNSQMNGFNAFGVNWVNVGGFSARPRERNNFQAILISRPDYAAGDFDIQFNYGQIHWDESGNAVVGLTKGTGVAGTHYQLPGSLSDGAFLNFGTNALISGSNIGIAGRYVYRIRNGQIELSPVTSINTAKPFYSTFDLGLGLNTVFDGGVLRVHAASSFTANFTINNLGGTIDADGKAATFSGVFSDAAGSRGALTIKDNSAGGKVTLSAASTYTGATTVAGGTLALAGSGSIASSSGVNLSAAGAKFDVSGLTSKATTIQDFSGVAGTTVNAGATVLTVGSANSTTFASEITGSGGLNKVGSGTLEITGNSAAFTGQNTVSAGHLKVNGYLGGSSLDVGSGSLLSGSGTVGGQTTIKAGGTISPGNSIGTLNVAGSFTQEGGSTYQVEVDPKSTSSDRIAVSGSANLGGAQLSVTKTSGEAYILDTKYTVLTAAGGVNGKYTIAGDTAVSAFYNLQDQYDANNVYLKVAQTTSFQKAGETFNQIATGAAVQSTPTGSKLHNLVGNMQDFATARAAFDQMSGEIYASMAGARLSDATEILQAATDRSRNAFCADASPQTPDTVQTCQVNPDKAVRWAQVVGSRATTNTDGNAAALARNSAGLVVGADMKVGGATRAGVLFNAKNTSYSVNDRLSSAKQQDVGVGIYASGKAVEAVNIDYRVGATYTHHDVTANRRVNFKGLDESFKSNFKASTVQFFGEIGRLIAVSSNATIEPFANVAFVRNDQKAFNEQAVGESKDLSALHAGKSSQDVAYTTLGMRGAVDYTFGTAKLSLRGLVGLRHTISKNIPLSTHQFSQSDEFTVAGVPVAKNLAVAEIGVRYDVNEQISVGVSYSGQYASGSKNHGVKATFEYKF